MKKTDTKVSTEAQDLTPQQILSKQANAPWVAPDVQEPKVKLTLQKVGEDKTQDVFLSVNFKDYIIKYDHEVLVPKSVVEVLKNTSITTMVQDPHTEKMVPVKRPRFAYTVEAA